VTQFCGAREYTCENSGICIGIDKICDGTVDCIGNEEDERTHTEEPTKCLGPKNFTIIDLFDAFTDEQIDSTAIYQSDKKVVKLSNITNEMPYILKKSGQEITRFYLMTNMISDNDYDKTFFIGEEKGPRNISLYGPKIHRFLSFLIVKGKQDLKIEDGVNNDNLMAEKLYHQYLNFTENRGIELKEDEVTKNKFKIFWNSITEEAWQKIAASNKNEKSFSLNLGSLFDYTKEYKLSISLQDDDIISTINMNFNVSDANCHFNLANPVKIVETNVETIEFKKFGK
jgi:hypothetical protein